MNQNLKICFIGGGNMASALISGMAGNYVAANNIYVLDHDAGKRTFLAQTYGVTASEDLAEAVATCDVIIPAVKPQQYPALCAAIKPHLRDQLLISIAAGIGLSDLSRWLGDYASIIRVMPNTPSLVGAGMSGIVAMASVSKAACGIAEAIMQSVGEVVWLDEEKQMDALTAVSGSGPAYVFYFIEAMQQAAQEMGLTQAQGDKLALETVLGAAKLAVSSDDPAALLRERVTSKGGTTHAAISSMEAAGVKTAIMQGMKAAQARSIEMGRELGEDA